MISESFMKT